MKYVIFIHAMIAVMLVPSIFGVNPYMNVDVLNVNILWAVSALIGFSGAVIALRSLARMHAPDLSEHLHVAGVTDPAPGLPSSPSILRKREPISAR